MGPWIGERTPSRFELGESLRIPRHDDRMLIDLQTRRLIDDGGDFQRLGSVEEPGTQRRAVTEVIEQRTTAGGSLVEPTVRLTGRHLVGGHLDLVGRVPKRPTIAVVEMHFQHLANGPSVDQSLRRCDGTDTRPRAS